MHKSLLWRVRNLFTAAVLFFATAAFTLWQNARVAVLWDISYLLDTAYRISLGQLPYRDFPFAHAPLSFLLHAALIHFFGRVYSPHIDCAAIEAGVATILTWSILLHLLQRHYSSVSLSYSVEELSARVIGNFDRNAEHATTEAVMLVSPRLIGGNKRVNLTKAEDESKPSTASMPLAAPTTNPLADRAWQVATLLSAPLVCLGIYAIYPHPIYDSDCILAVLFALYLLQRATDSALLGALAGAAAVLPLFFKQNIGLPFLLVTFFAVGIIAFARRKRAPQICFFAGAIAAFGSALFLLYKTVGLQNYLHWTLTFAAQRRLPGLDQLLTIYQQISLLWTIPAALVAVVLLRIERLRGARWVSPAAFLLLAAPFLWTLVEFARTDDIADRADQLLSLWPHLLILSAALTVANLRLSVLKRSPNLTPLLPLILLATVHGAFLSQQLWGSTYALWPLLALLITTLLMQLPAVARPLAVVISATFLICGALYATSHERLGYIYLDGDVATATLPELNGLATPGSWIPGFEELVRSSNDEIPSTDAILLLPGDTPFYFATGRTPQFPVLLFDPATNPYSPQEILEQVNALNVRWLIVSRNLQLTAPPSPDLPEILRTLQPEFTLAHALTNYDIYRRR